MNKIRHLLRTLTVASPLLLLLFLIGCGMQGLHIEDSHEEPIPDDKTIIQRHFHYKSSGGLMIATRTREGNFVTYIVVGKGDAFPPRRYQVVYKLVDGYWKHVRTRNIGLM